MYQRGRNSEGLTLRSSQSPREEDFTSCWPEVGRRNNFQMVQTARVDRMMAGFLTARRTILCLDLWTAILTFFMRVRRTVADNVVVQDSTFRASKVVKYTFPRGSVVHPTRLP